MEETATGQKERANRFAAAAVASFEYARLFAHWWQFQLSELACRTDCSRRSARESWSASMTPRSGTDPPRQLSENLTTISYLAYPTATPVNVPSRCP